MCISKCALSLNLHVFLFLTSFYIIFTHSITLYSFLTYSGTVLDLPYRFTADGDMVGMQRDQNFDFDALLIGAVVCCLCDDLFGCLFSILDELL